MQLRALGLVRMHPEGDERFAPQLQRTGESFTRKLRHAGLQQLMRLNAPASAGQNMQMWKVLLTHFHQPHGIFWLITGDDDRLRLFRSRRAQQLQLGGIAKIDFIAIVAHQIYRADVPLQYRNTHLIGHQQATNDLTKATKPDNNHLRLVILHPRRLTGIVRRVQPSRQ